MLAPFVRVSCRAHHASSSRCSRVLAHIPVQLKADAVDGFRHNSVAPMMLAISSDAQRPGIQHDSFPVPIICFPSRQMQQMFGRDMFVTSNIREFHTATCIKRLTGTFCTPCIGMLSPWRPMRHA